MRRVLLAAMLVAGILVHARPASACTCAVRSVPEQFEAASAVFGGQVRSIKPAADGRLAVGLDVSVLYKGDTGRRIAVRTAQESGGCGFPFAPEQRYVVFAAGGPGAFTTGLCDGTTDDLNVVVGITPIKTFPPPGDELPGNVPGSRSLPIGTAAGLFTLVLAASVWAWMMRARPPRPLA